MINGGVSSNGSGLKHASTNGSCTMDDIYFNYCKILLTWPGIPFADTNYDVVCMPKTGYYPPRTDNDTGFILYVTDADKTTTSVNVTVQMSVVSSHIGFSTVSPGISCIAIHD